MTVSLRPGVHRADAGDGSILLDERSGSYYHLNDTATRMLVLLLEGRSEAAVVERLGKVYAVEPYRLARDLDELLRHLCEKGLISR